MNLLLIDKPDYCDNNRVRITGRRFDHLTQVLNAAVGDILKAGQLNGQMGEATLLELTESHAEFTVELSAPPPAPLPVTLILALPRPKFLKRIFQTIAAMGIKELHLINSYRVEKSYWQSPWLSAENIHQQLLLGLEQGVDTRLPIVHQHKRFKPFVEDTLPSLMADRKSLLAIPGDYPPCPTGLSERSLLVVGPEGGFIAYENDKLMAAGCQPVSLGNRILKVETAVTALLARLF